MKRAAEMMKSNQTAQAKKSSNLDPIAAAKERAAAINKNYLQKKQRSMQQKVSSNPASTAIAVAASIAKSLSVNKHQPQPSRKVFIEIPLTAPGPGLAKFPLLLELQGPNGQYLYHISTTTGTTVQLMGFGSGAADSVSSREALHFMICGPTREHVDKAEALAQNLIGTVRVKRNHFYQVSRYSKHINSCSCLSNICSFVVQKKRKKIMFVAMRSIYHI